MEHRAMQSVEIDTRVIDRAAGLTVVLFSYDTPFGLTFGVQVERHEEAIHSWTTQDRAEALDLYFHPFTRPECPNVWARDFQTDEDDDYGSDEPREVEYV